MRSIYFYICFTAIALYGAVLSGCVLSEAYCIHITENVAIANFVAVLCAISSITCLSICYAGITDDANNL
jgi:hypothetical protein